MSLKLTSLASLVLLCLLAVVPGCGAHDERGVDVERAYRSGYMRVRFAVVEPNAETRPAGTGHDVYFDETIAVPSEASERAGAHTRVPDDRGNLGYSFVVEYNVARLEIVDLSDRDERDVPRTLALYHCARSGMSAPDDEPIFDSPFRAADGSFVRVQLVELRYAICFRFV